MRNLWRGTLLVIPVVLAIGCDASHRSSSFTAGASKTSPPVNESTEPANGADEIPGSAQIAPLTTAAFDSLIDYAMTHREEAIRDAKQRIAGLSQSKMSVQKKKEIAKKLNDHIAALNAGEAMPLPPLQWPLSKNAAGILPPIRILQVIDDENLIATCEFPNGSHDLWIKCIDASALVDDEHLRMTNAFEVAGTRTYLTVLNANRTVMQIAPIDSRQVIAAFKSRLEESKPAKPVVQIVSARPTAASRKWSSEDGQFSVNASYVGRIGDVVKLRRDSDGKVIEVPLDKFCDEDRAYVKNPNK